jgi:hypothetical protein
LLFDDSTWKGWRRGEPPVRRPKFAIDTFCRLYGNQFKVLQNGGQVYMQKID